MSTDLNADTVSSPSNVTPVTGSEVDDQVAALLRAVDQRYTTGRRRLVAALQAGAGPLTINQIAATDTNLRQSSIYRNLTLLEEAGAVARVVTNDDFARYELTEELTAHHHHLICTNCGAVIDFELDSRTERTLDRALANAADALGFTPADHRLDLLGTCNDCNE